ncbi:MAG: hypothetical protein KAJ19_19450 [Gammaproteobacteria bacterium]|nr:hypothetical protein [Gammaproteobacteria bacterium]
MSNNKGLAGIEVGIRLIAAAGLIVIVTLSLVYVNGNVKFQAKPDSEYCLLNSKYSIESDGKWFKIKKADGTYLHDAMRIMSEEFEISYNLEDRIRIRKIEAETTINNVSAARSKDSITYNYHMNKNKKLAEEYDKLKKKKNRPQEEIDAEITKLKTDNPRYWDNLYDAVFHANKHIEIKGEIEYGTFNKVCCD